MSEVDYIQVPGDTPGLVTTYYKSSGLVVSYMLDTNTWLVGYSEAEDLSQVPNANEFVLIAGVYGDPDDFKNVAPQIGAHIVGGIDIDDEKACALSFDFVRHVLMINGKDVPAQQPSPDDFDELERVTMQVQSDLFALYDVDNEEDDQ